MVKLKQPHEKAKNVSVSISPEDWSLAKEHGLRWSDLMRMAVSLARDDIARKQREEQFGEMFASLKPELKIYLGKHNIPMVPEKFQCAWELTRFCYTSYRKPLGDARPSVEDYFLDHYKNLVLRKEMH